MRFPIFAVLLMAVCPLAFLCLSGCSETDSGEARARALFEQAQRSSRARARESDPPARLDLVEGDIWMENFEDAKSLARDEGRDILMDFYGSDWWRPSVQLDREVFRYQKFADYAESTFVLVRIDIPRDPSHLSESTQAQNEALQVRFSIQGIPTILLADAQGRVYAKTGYESGGPDGYIEHLETLKQIRVARDKAITAASELTGIARAQQLNEALEILPRDLIFPSYEEEVAEIVRLDEGNEAGLRQPWRERLMESRLALRILEIRRFGKPWGHPIMWAMIGDAAKSKAEEGKRLAATIENVDTMLSKLDAAEAEFADYAAGRIPMIMLRLDLLHVAGRADEIPELADSVLADDVSGSVRQTVFDYKLSALEASNRIDEALEVLAAKRKASRFGDSVGPTRYLLKRANFLAQLERVEEAREALKEARKLTEQRLQAAPATFTQSSKRKERSRDNSFLRDIDELEARLVPPTEDAVTVGDKEE